VLVKAEKVDTLNLVLLTDDCKDISLLLPPKTLVYSLNPSVDDRPQIHLEDAVQPEYLD
jgi:hypothetical protein